MGQATSHNHGSGGNHQSGDRPRSIGGSGVNFGSQHGQWPHAGGTDILKDASPFDGQVRDTTCTQQGTLNLDFFTIRALRHVIHSSEGRHEKSTNVKSS